MKTTQILMGICGILCCFFPINAQNINYKTLVNGGCYVAASPDASGDIVIPEQAEIEGTKYDVKFIDDNAFDGNTNITSITITGSSLYSVGQYAFRNCTSLTTVTFSKNITTFGYGAFTGCNALNKVNYVGEDLSHLFTITYKNYNLDANPLNLAHNLYHNDVLVTSLTIPPTVTSISPCAFVGATCLQGKLKIPTSVKKLDTYCFDGCTGLDGVVYEGTLEEWMAITFSGVAANPLIVAGNLYLNNDESKLIESIEIPASITKINSRTFEGATCLNGVINIPATVTATDSYCFAKCTGITAITGGDGLKTIGSQSFQNCTGLQSAVIGDNVTSIGNYAFDGCTALTTLKMGAAVQIINSYAFRKCSALTGPLVLPQSLTTIGSDAFSDCSSLSGTLSFPASLTSLGIRAFGFCSSLNAIVFSTGLTKLTSSVFQGCSSLTEIVLPDNITEIESSAFSSCTRLTRIDTGNGMITIGSYAFSSCSALQSVTLGTSVKTVMNYAFSSDKAIKEIFCNNPTPPTTYSNTFSNVTVANIPLYVPQESLTDYKAKSVWKDFNVKAFGADVAVSKIVLSSNAENLKIGDSILLKATVIPDDATNPEITWSSSAPTIASVSDVGLVTAVSKGQTVITVASVANPDVIAQCAITVSDIDAETITLSVADNAEPTFRYGQTLQLLAVISPDNTTDKTLVWKSSDNEIASVNENGLVTAGIKSGDATITVSSVYNINANIVITNRPFTVAYKLDDEVFTTQTYDFGSEIVAPKAPTKEGYTFDGWKDLPKTMPAEDITVSGSYTVNSYTASFYINDEFLDAFTVEYGTKIPLPEVTVPENMTFSGWEPEVPETMPAMDIEFYGSFKEDSSISYISVDKFEGFVNVYDFSGNLILCNCEATSLKQTLAPGLYIVVSGNQTFKTIIK